ncbi:unnamed protein product [Lactuca saligna]|uniref:Uncharacterized protein n=1 Tax=Lactuca saligna TaxID=75948 RepID=A0AA36E3H5_LACSI|nr:unnamed protein product [Lactuca saligna]
MIINPISTSCKPETPHKILFHNEYMGQIKSSISNFKTPPSVVTLGEGWRPLCGSMGKIVYIWVGRTSGEDDDNLWQIFGDDFIVRKALETSSIVQVWAVTRVVMGLQIILMNLFLIWDCIESISDLSSPLQRLKNPSLRFDPTQLPVTHLPIRGGLSLNIQPYKATRDKKVSNFFPAMLEGYNR